MTSADPQLPPPLRRVGDALGSAATDWQRPECGLSVAERWATRLSDGRRVFVKAAADEATATWLRTERDAASLVGPDFAPSIIAWLEPDGSDRGEYPILVTEDLSAAYWPAGTGSVHWRAGDMAAVLSAVDSLSRRDPGDLDPLVEPRPLWAELLTTGDLERFGLCDHRWIRASSSALLECDARPWPEASVLVHGDIRSDNLCLLPDGSARFVDWAHAGRGTEHHDLVNLLPTLRLEGGPDPASVLSEPVATIVRMAGASITRAVKDDDAPSWLREVLMRLAAINLQWVADILDLPAIKTP